MHERLLVAGIDEVGIGPLAGPVVAGAVILAPDHPIEGITDSKALTDKKRGALAQQIKEQALAWAIGQASVAEIDQMNVLQASHLAMRRAVHLLAIRPHKLLVDGNKLPKFDIPAEAVIKGDLNVPAIGAASIIAKVFRDEEMMAMADKYPGYGFARNKGYPTKQHRDALQRIGVTQIHRRSYAPVQQALSVHATQPRARQQEQQ